MSTELTLLARWGSAQLTRNKNVKPPCFRHVGRGGSPPSAVSSPYGLSRLGSSVDLYEINGRPCLIWLSALSVGVAALRASAMATPPQMTLEPWQDSLLLRMRQIVEELRSIDESIMHLSKNLD